MKQIIIKYGLIGSLLMILSSVVTYLLGVSAGLFTSSIIAIVFFAALIYTAVLAVREARTLNNDTITVQNAFGTAISVFLVVAILNSAFSYVLFNYIDPDYAETSKMEVIEKMEKRLEKFDMDEEQIEESIAKVEMIDYSYTMKKAIRSIGGFLAISLLISFIIAQSVKKDLNQRTPQL